MSDLPQNAQEPSKCECGFSAEICAGNPCMRKKVHLAGLTPGSKWPATGARVNTDREVWRGPDEGHGDYYADSVHVTEGGGVGINCGGHVIVKPLREWHALAAPLPRLSDETMDVTRPRVPKVRTSHHRNKEEAARLQALVAERYESAGVREALEAILQNLDDLDKQRTPGPWRKAHDSVVGGYDARDDQRQVRLIARCDAEWSGFGLDLAKAPKNARFIVALENAWPKIRAALALLQTESKT